jgi:hypothetical protein
MKTGITVAALGISLLASAPLAAQTIFTTENYRNDSAFWSDPAYYGHNTVREIRDMQEQNRFGEQGSGVEMFDPASPYPFRTSDEHYAAWRDEADGGTRHSLQTLPDWTGRWNGNESWIGGDDVQVSTIAAMLTPQYREYLVQQAKAEAEGRHFWPASFCLPRGFLEAVVSSPREFILQPHRAWVMGDTYTENLIRWVYTDGSAHSSGNHRFSRWHGESIAFWDEDALIIHTDQIRAWKGPVIEWSDQLTSVERYQRVGDVIEGEITLYDPVAFLQPMHARFVYERIPDDAPAARPIYSTCTDTNGPSSNVFINADGALNERVPGDPLHWDVREARPWAVHYSRGE